jgi:hypothetical protein
MGPSLSTQQLDQQLQLCIQRKTEVFMLAPRGQTDMYDLNHDVKLCYKRYSEALEVLKVQEKISKTQ